jgi:transposase
MTKALTVTIEPVDDIPVLLTSATRLGLVELVDQHFKPHGNWQGLSPGRVLTGWLAYILSEGDHRLNQAQDWVAGRSHVLQPHLGPELRVIDFTDDRLAIGLDLLSDDGAWTAFEAALNQRTLRVYDLAAQCVRLDTTSASGYWEVTEDGLFQFGHSKDHRPDLPQIKVMLATLDPLGLPLVTQVVAGAKADDPLYIPAIEQVRMGVGRRGLLYVGDCKLMALATRAYLAAGGDHYLAPLALTHLPQEAMDAYLQPVWAQEQALTPVYRNHPTEGSVKIAEGFECAEQLTATVAGRTITWTERRLVVRSLQHTAAATVALDKRLAQAEAAIAELNTPKQGKIPFADMASLQQAFGRLKGRSLSLTPMYLADDDRATGLIRWLTVGLRVLTLLEGVVRRRLGELGEQLAGLYAGNPKRATAHPTAESLLRAFKGLALSFVTLGGQTYRHITPLSEVQHKILRLLDYPVTIYTELAVDSANPP